MKQTNIIFIVFLVILLPIYMLVQFGKPSKEKPTDWRPSFSNEDIRAYGTAHIFNMMGDLFGDSEINTVQRPTYNIFADSFYWNVTAYVVINNTFNIDEYDNYQLLDFVYEGNHALIASESFSRFFADSMGIEVETFFMAFNLNEEEEQDSIFANFIDPELKDKEGYDFSANTARSYFSFYDDSKTEVLAVNNDDQPNLIRVKWGEGTFILCSSPYLMTNYHFLLNNHHDFIAKAFSHLPPNTDILWDEYYKAEYLKGLANSRKGTDELSFILAQPELAWAWYLGLFTLILYVILERKRKQRIIPVIKPHPNLTVDFVQTIGRLYFQRQNHKNIAEKKIKVLLEYIRTRYFLKTQRIDMDFVKSLAAKSEIPEGDLTALFNSVLRIKKRTSITEDTLIELNEMIENFYINSPR